MLEKRLFTLCCVCLMGCKSHTPNLPNPIPEPITESLKNIPIPISLQHLPRKHVKKEYFTGGKIRSKFIMSDKTGLNGILEKYGYTGKITSTVPIHNGVMHGVEILYDNHHRIRRKVPYVNGKKHGVVEVFYPNGDRMAQISYVNNIRQGRAAKYDKDGSMIEEVTFENGHLLH